MVMISEYIILRKILVVIFSFAILLSVYKILKYPIRKIILAKTDDDIIYNTVYATALFVLCAIGIMVMSWMIRGVLCLP